MIKQVGKYKLEKVLGKGAMGTVYLSRHPELDIPVAIKILNHAKAAMDPDFRSRFIKEGRLAGQVNHQNVIRVYDAGNEGETYFLVMEYIEGNDAKEVLDQKGPMDLNEVLNIAICCAQALTEAHRLGIIHRDIKPDNIMVTSKGRIKLADMGIAKQLQDDFSTTITGMAMGTPYYMSPEQAVDASSVDGRCDIYSLGATIYHLLTGYRPFNGESTVEILMQHARATLPHPQTLRPDLPENICAVIYKMMEKKPENRYANCAELVEDLSAIRYTNAPIEELSIYDSQTIKAIENDWKTTRPFGDPPPQIKKNHKLLYSLIGVIVLLILILAVSKKKKDRENKPPENDNVVDAIPDVSPLEEMKEKNLILTSNNEIIVYSGKERKEVKRFTAKAADQNPLFATLIASDNQYYYLFTDHTDKILKFSKDGKDMGHIPLPDKMIGVEFLCLPDKRFALFDNRLDNVSIFSYSGKLIKTVPIPTAKSMQYQNISAIAGGPFLFFTDSETAQIFKLNLINYEISEFLNLRGKISNLSTISFSRKTKSFYITDKDQGIYRYTASAGLKKLDAPKVSFNNIAMKVRNKNVFFLENTVAGKPVNQKLYYLNMENGRHTVIATFKKKVVNFVLVDRR